MSEIYIGENENWFIDGVDTGKPSRGAEGKSAYDIAISYGYEGDMFKWVNDLKGESAYDLAVNAGYKGTKEEWLNTLRGEAGLTPHIGENGNWFVGEEDTGILADVKLAVKQEVAEALKELENKIIFKSISFGNYTIEPQVYTSISVPYTPPEGYKVVGYTLQLPPRYLAAIRYIDGAFSGILFNCTQRSGTYGVGVLITLAKQ